MATLTEMANWLAGEFDNREQAIAHPVWFVHLKLWQRPLPFPVDGYPALFLEQANIVYADRPYRQRIVILRDRPTLTGLHAGIDGNENPQSCHSTVSPDPTTPPSPDAAPLGTVEYRALRHPEQLRGAGANPALLQDLHPDDLLPLPGCQLTLTYQNQRFSAQPFPQTRCYFQYEGQLRQVVLGFEVSAEQFLSFDRGVDPETGQGLWGALMGPYEFVKRQQF